MYSSPLVPVVNFAILTFVLPHLEHLISVGVLILLISF